MSDPYQPKRKGFAGMDPTKQREIASKGGRVAHERGVAHEWTKAEASAAGRLGGRKSKRPPNVPIEDWPTAS